MSEEFNSEELVKAFKKQLPKLDQKWKPEDPNGGGQEELDELKQLTEKLVQVIKRQSQQLKEHAQYIHELDRRVAQLEQDEELLK